MRLTITDDEGEVYVVATNVRHDRGHWIAADNEGEDTTVDALLMGAAVWERSKS